MVLAKRWTEPEDNGAARARSVRVRHPGGSADGPADVQRARRVGAAVAMAIRSEEIFEATRRAIAADEDGTLSTGDLPPGGELSLTFDGRPFYTLRGPDDTVRRFVLSQENPFRALEMPPLKSKPVGTGVVTDTPPVGTGTVTDTPLRDAFSVDPSPYRRLPPKTLEERVADLEAVLAQRLEEDSARSKSFTVTATRTLKSSMYLLVLSSLLQLGIGVWKAFE